MSENVTPRAQKVVFVGLGNMGWPMAANLAADGRHVIAVDADPAREAKFVAEHGGEAFSGAPELGDVDAIVLMLPTSAIVREALLGPSDLARKVPRSTVVVDMSSSDPTDTASLTESLGELGLRLVDAPVSGGVPRAQAGTLAIMMGCDDERDADIAMDVIAPLSDRVFRTGRVGSGHAMKALNNYVAAAAFAASSEAVIVGRHFGLTPRVVTDVLNASTGRSFMSETTMNKIAAGDYTTGFALGLLDKDVNIAVRLAATAATPAPVCSEVSRRLNAATAELGFGVDHAKAFDYWDSEPADS